MWSFIRGRDGNQQSQPWGLAQVEPPWGRRTSIYDHIKSNLKTDGTGLTEAGEKLPDDAHASEDGGIRWAAGALGHHQVGEGDEKTVSEQIGELLQRSTRQSSPSNIEALYETLKTNRAVAYADSLLEHIRIRGDLHSRRIHTLATWLATKAADREPVKTAIALLGLFEQPPDEAVLFTLGAHEEFTVLAAVALANSVKQPDLVLWKLSKQVNGWGRIQTVERLANTTHPEIKKWLLREGYKNSVMYEYLAYTCAVSGGLAAALRTANIDVPPVSRRRRDNLSVDYRARWASAGHR
jgi:hypothetical protein